MNLTFRDAGEADLPAIVGLVVDDDIAKIREQDALPDEYVRAYAEMAKARDNKIVIAELDGELA